MYLFIIVFGALTFLAGAIIATHPGLIVGYLQKKLDKLVLQVLNVVVRVVFGLLLISQADLSKFPFVIEMIGWFCIAIALVLTVMGRERFIRAISWALSLVEENSRVGGVLVLMFGAFLMYAFI